MSSFGTNSVMDSSLNNPLRYSIGGDNNNNNNYNEVCFLFLEIFFIKK